MMVTVTWVLVIAALIAAIVACAGRLPLCIAVILLAVLELLRIVPLK